MTKRKLMLVALSLCMVAILAMGGTLAYLTDTDYDKNVMTVGNVKIEQHEHQRVTDDEGNITSSTTEPFEDNKIMLPVVGDPWTLTADPITHNGISYKTSSAANVVDKIITVENKSNDDVYIRTLIAFENTANITDLMGAIYNDDAGTFQFYNNAPLTINGKSYLLAVYTYTAAYEPKAITPASIYQIYMNSKVTSDHVAELNGSYEVLALSQAVQAAGFEDAVTALNAGFGEITDNAAGGTLVSGWFTENAAN